jgi:hypothetical protein
MLDIECKGRYILRTIDHGLVNSQTGEVIRNSQAYGEIFCADCEIDEQFRTEGMPHFGAREIAETQIEDTLQDRCLSRSTRPVFTYLLDTATS